MTDESLQGRRVLIVEDEMMISMMLEDMVADLGGTVAAVAASPKQALQFLEDQSPDAAILDVNLDGQNSYDVAAVLEQRGTPFLFSTGYGAAALEEPYRSRRVLQKPFRLEDLAEAMADILSGKAILTR